MAKDSEPKRTTPTPFEKFQTLARRIVLVPKQELAREIANYEAKKKRRRKTS